MKQIKLTLLLFCLHLCYPLECEETSYPPDHSNEVPQYIIDLDYPPEVRWYTLIKDTAPKLKALLTDVQDLMKELLGNHLFGLLNDYIPQIGASLPAPYYDEIKGISQAAGVPFAHITMYNIFYEVFVLCTSIVMEDEHGNIYHGRNLDNGAFLGWNAKNNSWKVTELLKPLTVKLDWRKGGKSVFKSINFAGYIGILTAVKENKFSFSLDKRMSFNNGIVGILEWMLFNDHEQYWVSFLARDVLEQAESFEEAKKMLTERRLIAPVYYILAGIEKGQGVLITRYRDDANVLPLGSHESPYSDWYLIETNYDHWKSPPFFDNRRTPAAHCLDLATQSNATISLLYNVLSTKPIKNKSTVYTALMHPKSGYLAAWKSYCPDPCYPWLL